VLQKLPYNEKADVFSFGVLAYEVSMRCPEHATQVRFRGLSKKQHILAGVPLVTCTSAAVCCCPPALQLFAREILQIALFNTGRAAQLGVKEPLGYARLVRRSLQ
jgi:hypothetical protein